MTSILGPYYSPHHWRAEDEAYMQQLDPAWIRNHQPSARSIATAQRCAPNANIMLRSWDIDDSNGDRKREMYADPKGAAKKHLDMWRAKHDELCTELQRNGWPINDSNWYYGLVNEPDPAYVPQTVEYTAEAMRLVRGTLIRLGLVCSSVGTFQKPNEGNAGWTQFIPLQDAINEGGHILIAHEYWQPEGPNYGDDGGNLAWRHHSIPLDVPILIGESGANGYIYGRHSQQDDAGWRKFMEAPQFAAQVKEYIERCDKRVKGVLLYMLDFHSDQWWSFDSQPAMHQLLAIKETCPQVASPFAATKPPIETHLPSVGSGKPTGDNWQRALEWLMRWEGGYQNNSLDVGNWTGCAQGKGINKGTNFGISACSYPDLDIINLTKEQAAQIYKRDYWIPSGASSLPWPYCLLVFDTAVLHGVGTANKWQTEVGTDPYAFAAKRLRTYTRLGNWSEFGAGWTNRTADLLAEMGK